METIMKILCTTVVLAVFGFSIPASADTCIEVTRDTELMTYDPEIGWLGRRYVPRGEKFVIQEGVRRVGAKNYVVSVIEKDWGVRYHWILVGYGYMSLWYKKKPLFDCRLT
jgi:hypothetical protein